jgi:Carboxypeptidase regulatory-like domain
MHHFDRGRRLRRLSLVLVAAVVLFATAGSTRVVSSARAGSTADALASLAAGLPVGSEIPSLRTQTSDTFVGGNGTFVARVYSGAVNYQDSSGNWQPIDNILHAGPDGSAPGFDNGANRFQLQLPQQIQGAPVRLTDGSDWVSFSLDGATGTGSASGNKETFAGALPNVDATYTSLSDGVDQDLVLNSPSAQRTFSYTIQTSPGLSAAKAADGSITFTDSSGQAQFTVQPPVMSDANGQQSGVGAASYQLSSISGGYNLSVNADSAWLSSADRAWPVTIDPTTLVLSSYMDTFIRSDKPNTNYYGQTVDKVGWDSYGVRRALLYFDVQDSLPTGVEVLDSTMNLYLSAESTSANVQVGAYGLSKIFTTSATWNAWFPPYTWDTPGGDYDAITAYDQEAVGGSLGIYSWDLSALTWEWYTNEIANDGILLKDVDETTGANLFSFNSGVASSNQPVLSIDYTTTIDEVDDNGTVETDQSSPNSRDLYVYPTGPTEVDANGGTGSYPTDAWTSEETDMPNGMQVVSSTGSNTWAISGGVTDANTGSIISGATATLTSTTTPVTNLSATSDSNGTFAFVDVPTSSSWNLQVTAAGYGAWTINDFTPASNETYVDTAEMTSSPQSEDLSGPIPDTSQTTSTSSLIGYVSQRRLPPTIRVRVYPFSQNPNQHCVPSGAPATDRTYGFKFYLLKTAASEIYTSWPKLTVQANMEAEENFAWTYTMHPDSTSYDLDNLPSDRQCFDPMAPVPHKWKTLWWQDPLTHRVATSDGKIERTYYASGGNWSFSNPPPACDAIFSANGGKLAQWGSWALEQGNCGYNTWQSIDNYYYPGTVRAAFPPNIPKTSNSTGAGTVTLTFKSQVNDGANHTSPVGWNYYLQARISGSWVTIHQARWTPGSRSVPTSYTNHTSQCFKYRVRAWNPSGYSPWASYNGGNTICPA